MDSELNPQNLTEFSEPAETDETLSIDEFFKQLEAKEKDLEISSEMVIELDDFDFEEPEIPDFVKADLPPVKIEPAAPLPRSAAPVKNASNQIETHNLQTELTKLQDRLAHVEAERAAMFETARRRHNEFENYKNRTERERSETFRNQLGNLATMLLPVLDNMSRALDSTKNTSEQKNTEFQQFVEGIEMVSQQLNEILAEMGVHPIIALGENFDPHLHEAVATEMTNEMPANTVTGELQRGYRIGEKIIRPSLVRVAISSNPSKLLKATPLSPKNLAE